MEPWPLVCEVGVARDGSVTWEPVPLPRASDAHCPHQGRQLLLEGTRCQASTPEHFGNRYSALPPFLSSHGPTDRSNTVGPGPLPPAPFTRTPRWLLLPAPGEYWTVTNPGQLEQKKGEERLSAYCAGVVLSAALRLARTVRDLRMRLAARTIAKTPAGGFCKFQRVGGKVFRWSSLENCPRKEPWSHFAWQLWPVLLPWP